MFCKVFYKCRCMKAEASVLVMERKPDEDVVAWMENKLGAAVGRDHRRRSPKCKMTKMEYAKVPMDKVSGLVGKDDRSN